MRRILRGLALLVLAPSSDAGPVDDPDGDGIPFIIDNCIFVGQTNPCDTDADGFGNACDGDLNNDGLINGVDFSGPSGTDFLELFQSGARRDRPGSPAPARCPAPRPQPPTRSRASGSAR